MKTAKYVVAVLGLLVSLCACNREKRDTTIAPPEGFSRLLQGEYLSATYIDALQRTHSPDAAGKAIGEIGLVIVKREGAKVLLTPIFNFHEGSGWLAVNADGSLSDAESGSPDTSGLSVNVLDDGSLRVASRTSRPARYIFVKSVEDYVAKAVLVGRYHDNQGRTYEFREDGWAVFPDHKFKFEVGVDYVVDDFDYFYSVDDHKMWAFAKNGAALKIQPAHQSDDGGDEVDSTKPSVLLREAR